MGFTPTVDEPVKGDIYGKYRENITLPLETIIMPLLEQDPSPENFKKCTDAINQMKD